MIEVEVKISVIDRAAVEKGLQEAGFLLLHQVTEEDRYYDNAVQQIRKGGQALRIRSIRSVDGTTDSVITFKGQKADSISMTRQELETGIQDPEVLHHILEALGYSVVPPVVTKTRTEYVKGQMHACLDQVKGLGEFLELEIVEDESGDQEKTREAALGKIDQMLQELGYSMKDSITNSYLSILQGEED